MDWLMTLHAREAVADQTGPPELKGLKYSARFFRHRFLISYISKFNIKVKSMKHWTTECTPNNKIMKKYLVTNSDSSRLHCEPTYCRWLPINLSTCFRKDLANMVCKKLIMSASAHYTFRCVLYRHFHTGMMNSAVVLSSI